MKILTNPYLVAVLMLLSEMLINYSVSFLFGFDMGDKNVSGIFFFLMAGVLVTQQLKYRVSRSYVLKLVGTYFAIITLIIWASTYSTLSDFSLGGLLFASIILFVYAVIAYAAFVGGQSAILRSLEKQELIEEPPAPAEGGRTAATASDDIVYADDHNLLGINYYWNRREQYNLSEEELNSVGFYNDRTQIHQDIVEPLQAVDAAFQQKNLRLYIKEGLRPKALYELIYQKRVEKYGQEETDRLLNMHDMPHASGKTVDVTLWDAWEEEEIFLRNGDDGMDAMFVDFYKHKEDEQSQRYHELQTWVINTMQDHGFRLGSRREYFHFDYRPEAGRNY